jgi:metal-dependent amidase/aminoacylase/carboxypeptidase family protein
MLDAGDFEGVDVCMMLHGANVDVIYAPFLSLKTVTLEYFGKASHASTTPWEGINALDAAMEVYTSIGLMRQQMRLDQRVHGIIVNGGQAPNIIPEYTKSVYIVRATRYDQVKDLQAKVEKIFDAAARSTGCTMKVEWGTHIKGESSSMVQRIRTPGCCSRLMANRSFLSFFFYRHFDERTLGSQV